jgi:glycerol-3-phosphate acyltransferase
MVLPVLFKIAARCHFTWYLAARKIKAFCFHYKNSTANISRAHHTPSLHTDISKCPLEGRENQTLVCDFYGTLLRSSSPFPFFMLVAFEGGGMLRALLLLLFSPVIYLMGSNGEVALRLMIFVTFFGLRKKDMNLVARAVLPKFYLENLDCKAYELMASCGRKVVMTSMPRVMVERFLKEYLGVEKVYGVELEMAKGEDYFTGFVSCGGHLTKQRALEDLFGEIKADIGLLSSTRDNLLIPYCKVRNSLYYFL